MVRARQDTLQALFGLADVLGFRPNWAAYNRALYGGSVPPVRARMTLSGLLKTVAYAAPGQAVPDGFWRIECGMDASNKYVPTEPSFLGDPMSGIYNTAVYVRGQRFFGPLCTVYYWILPTTTIDDDATDLNAGTTPLSDAFYETALYRGLSYLLAKERAENVRRIAITERIYKRRLQTLR